MSTPDTIASLRVKNMTLATQVAALQAYVDFANDIVKEKKEIHTAT